jgi:hypothetical protein
MTDFEVQRCSRKCAKTERELQPGETFYSALVPEPDSAGLRRIDFAGDAWVDPPEGTIAWWKSQIPGAGNKRAHWAPNDVILEYFQLLDGDPTKVDVRYVLALLMVRRRIARWEDTEADERGQEIMILYCPRQELEFRVAVQVPSAARIAEIEEELSRLLITPTTG